MLADQKIIEFLKAALECSIYICPLDPGLEYNELLQAAKDADFLDGEIHDAIPQAATLYWGGASKILPSQNDLLVLTLFGLPQEPDYRNPAAFHRVFEEMRLLVRQKGRANAHIERSVLTDRCTTKQSPEHDVQVALAILILNKILHIKDGSIRFVQGKENHGSPGDQPMPSRMPDGRRERPARKHAYPIVERIISGRNSSSPPHAIENSAQAAAAEPTQLPNDEWISASQALDLLGRRSSSHIAICTRANAGMVKARVSAQPRCRQAWSEGICEALDVTMGFLIQAPYGPVSRPVVALA